MPFAGARVVWVEEGVNTTSSSTRRKADRTKMTSRQPPIAKTTFNSTRRKADRKKMTSRQPLVATTPSSLKGKDKND